MFWVGGLVGVALESSTFRRWLAIPEERMSMNPFPALVIGITGAVMALHYQVYSFQVRLFPTRTHLPTDFRSR